MMMNNINICDGGSEFVSQQMEQCMVFDGMNFLRRHLGTKQNWREGSEKP